MCPSSVLPTDFPKRPGRKALCILCANKGDSISLLLVSQKLAPGEMADFSLGQGKYKWSLEQLVVPESKALLKKKNDSVRAHQRDAEGNERAPHGQSWKM